jgi:hypothetical protein
MLSIVFSGTAPILDNIPKTVLSLKNEVKALMHLSNGITCVQTGFFVPTQTGSYVFKMQFSGPATNAANGCFLAVNGTTIINEVGALPSGFKNSSPIPLTSGESYSFCYSVPMDRQDASRGIAAFWYSVDDGANQLVQDNQFYTVTDLNSNPLYNANSILQSLISSGTPSYIKPIANLLPTNVTANNLIATVPCPAIVPSISTSVINTMSNDFHCPVPVPSPVTCYRDICVMPPLVDSPGETKPVTSAPALPRKDWYREIVNRNIQNLQFIQH